jgi:hypothetical protein
MSDWDDQSNDSNQWKSADDNYGEQEDWQEMMARKNDGSFWTEFESSADTNETATVVATVEEEVDEADVWLDTLASISAEEIEFNIAENERADKVRQMQEWGFDDTAISNTFGVAMDDSLEKDVDGLQEFREQAYLDDVDWKKVESHSKVEKDTETGEAIRQQMVCTLSRFL